MNIVQFRAPGDPVPLDPPVRVTLPPRDPADVVVFKPKPRLSGQQKMERLRMLGRLALEWGLTNAEVSAFFGGGTTA